MKRRTLILSMMIAGTMTVCAGAVCAAAEAEAATEETAAEASAQEQTEAETEAESALPAFTYSGHSAVLACVCDYIADELAPMYSASDVLIPVPVIFGVDDTDEDHVKVYGDFWLFWYAQQDDSTLLCEAGGQNPGVLWLVRDGDGYAVEMFDRVTDGDGLEEDIHRICSEAGDFGVYDLEGLFLGSAVDKEALWKYALAVTLSRYVEDSGLNLTAYQDYGWDPVAIEPVRYARVNDELYRDTGEASFLLRCGNMDFSLDRAADSADTAADAADTAADSPDMVADAADTAADAADRAADSPDMTADATIPTENGQTNFGACEGQYGAVEGTIDLYYDGLYHIFEKVDTAGAADSGDNESGSGDDESDSLVVYLNTESTENTEGPDTAAISSGDWGKRVILYLDANPTTGCEWTSETDADAVSVSQSYTEDAHEEMMVGVGGTEEIIITPQAPGTVTVTLSYGQAWEDEPYETLSYTFEVSEDLQIRFTEGQD